MRKLLILIFIFSLTSTQAQTQNKFQIVEKGKPTTIVFDAYEAQTIKITANLLADDIERLTGVRPKVKNTLSSIKGNVIIIGSINESGFINKLIEDEKTDLSILSNSWEKYAWRFIKNTDGVAGSIMVIAGSDRRGTAYGTLDLSRKLGISPWYWWSDIAPVKVDEISISKDDFTSKEPSVKYRGIFLNDECWGLNPWASNTLEPEVGNIGPKTYSHIFELLLRLKANFIWPAMHPCTEAFYSNPDNPKMADAYGIVVGTSHAEPMLRNNVSEWINSKRGSFNFFSNHKNVLKYWDQRTAESSNYESIYTLGMRGIHDSGMVGANSMNEQVDALEKVISEQREMLKTHINKDETMVPQAFTAYKEVLDVYDAGLKLFDDITLVWPDDNYGYIKRLSNNEEQKRKGGSGIYYHLSYWGRPHDYLWLSSTHPSLIREEMIKAAWFESKDIWVANVGDIKPLEYNISLFLDMAYQADKFNEPLTEQQHLNQWYMDIFGQKVGAKVAYVMWSYYQLNFERRPEFMGWSQTEPTRKTHPTDYNHFEAGDEAQQRIDAFNSLTNEVRELNLLIPKRLNDAFYQLVAYPVINAGHINKKFLYLEKAYKYAAQGRSSANDYAQMAQMAYDSILIETDYFNDEISNGKWNGMMYQAPRSLPVFDAPIIPQWKFTDSGWGIAVEGDEEIRRTTDIKGPLEMPNFNRMTDRSFFVDIFMKGNEEINWSVTPSHDWIKISQYQGRLNYKMGQKQKRVWISIDWNALQEKGRSNGKITFHSTDDKKIDIAVYANNFLLEKKNNKPLFIEENGYLSIFAENFTRKEDNTFPLEILGGLGYSGNAVWTLPNTNSDKNEKKSSKLEYDFYTPRDGNITVHIYLLPTHPINKENGLRLNVSVNNDEEQVKSFETHGRSEEWKQNALKNNTVITTHHKLLSAGHQVLKIKIPDPGVILDRIEIDHEGLPSVYSVLPESRQK